MSDIARDRTARYEAVVAALSRVPPDRQEVLAALAMLPRLRSDLDAVERALIDAARDGGATWTEIASTLGLRTRQAAEQRRLRLTSVLPRGDVGEVRQHRRRQQIVDAEAGEPVVALRRAVTDLAGSVDQDDNWDSRGPAAVLARHTLQIAVDAAPGALVDLARLIATDLARLPGSGLGDPAADDALRRIVALVGQDLTRGDSRQD